MPTRLIFKIEPKHDMDDLAQQLIEGPLMYAQDLIEEAERFTEERNGETISLDDMIKAIGITEGDTIKSLEQTLAKAKAHKKRYED